MVFDLRYFEISSSVRELTMGHTVIALVLYLVLFGATPHKLHRKNALSSAVKSEVFSGFSGWNIGG